MYTVQVKCFNAPLQPAEIFGVKKVVEEKVPKGVNELGLTLTGVEWQNTTDLSDLVSSGRDRKPEEVAFAEECEIKSLIFRAERYFYLAKSYSLAGRRAEAYSLYSHACSLTDTSLMRDKVQPLLIRK
ncbi:hypothetical protein AgCh_031541 [Apium graveolens]